MGEQAYNALPTYPEWLTARGIRPRSIEVTVYTLDNNMFEGDILEIRSKFIPELMINEILASDTECYDCSIFTGRCASYAKTLKEIDGVYQRGQECIDSEKELLSRG